MTAAPLVTVVIATYNMAGFLATAVRSALAQTYDPIEVLVIDDGSTDTTDEEMRQFEDERVRYVRQHNQGQAAAKNRGVLEARGEYIAFLDADDYWRHDKLALQMALFENCLLYTSPSPRDISGSRMPSSA